MEVTGLWRVIQDRSKELQSGYISKKAIKDRIEDEVIDYTNKINQLTDENDILSKVILVLTESSNVARNNAKNHFEKIITEALQYVTQSTDYEFVIQEMVDRS